MDDLVRGVGSVCISASTLEWSLAYLTSVLRRWGDDKFVKVVSRSGEPLREFRKVVRSLAVLQRPEQAEAEEILADVERLLALRHRIVHSVMVEDLDPGGRLYEAWHAKSGDIWSVNPPDLNNLARDIKLCAAQVDTFGTRWEEQADRDGWPDLDAI
jgi:hypothetical protein